MKENFQLNKESHLIQNNSTAKKKPSLTTFQLMDKRAKANYYREIQGKVNRSPQVSQLRNYQFLANSYKTKIIQKKSNKNPLANTNQNGQSELNGVIQLMRLKKRDATRSARHTTGVLYMDGIAIKKFESNDNIHAEDQAYNKIIKKLKDKPPGGGDEIKIKLGLTKSPCTDGFSHKGKHFVKTNNKASGEAGCAQKLIRLHGMIVNGYQIVLQVYPLRPYTPHVKGGKSASLAALGLLRRQGIRTKDFKDSKEKFAEDDALSDTDSADEWHDKNRRDMEVERK